MGNEERAGQTVAAIREAGQRAIKVKADISREEGVLRLFETCDAELGVPYGLVNSAGIVAPYGRIDEVASKDIPPLMDLNINGTLLCTREAIKRMSTRHGGTGGSIVNLSSASSRLGGAGYSVPYAASKGAVDSFTWGVAQEVAGEGIRVNAVSPRRHRHRNAARRPRRERGPDLAHGPGRAARGGRQGDTMAAVG